MQFIQINWFYLAYPSATKGRGGQKLFLPLKGRRSRKLRENYRLLPLMAQKSLVYFEGRSTLRCLVKTLAMHTPLAFMAYPMHYICHMYGKLPAIHISTLALTQVSGFFFLIKLAGGEKMQDQLTYFKKFNPYHHLCS